MIDAPKGRVCNYTLDEDILLCKTWLNVFKDATVVGDQTRDIYWLRMEYFDAQNESGIECTDRSLRSRWSTINKDCQRWAAAMTSVNKINPSGTNDRDRVSAISLCSMFRLTSIFMILIAFFIRVLPLDLFLPRPRPLPPATRAASSCSLLRIGLFSHRTSSFCS